MDLTALKTFRYGASMFRRGQPVTLSDAQAKPLIEGGFVAESEPKAKAKAEAEAKKAAEKKD